MKLFPSLLIGCLVAFQLSAQRLTVKIVDANGQPVPNVTCYIRETSHGIITDAQGKFQTNIAAGNYTLEISSLGYERKTIPVSIPPEGFSATFVLEEKTYLLQEVIVTPGKEDPAYGIIRNVIAHAPHHFHQVKSYESDIYFKGRI